MALTITSIDRTTPEDPGDTCEAASAALAIYGMLMQASPEARPAFAGTVLELSEIVCAAEPSAVSKVVLQIHRLLSAQLPEFRNRRARHALECVQTICGIVPFTTESMPRRA